MKDAMSIRRLFSTYDKANHSTTYIIVKAILLFIVLSICVRIFMGICYSLLPSDMTCDVSTPAEERTINGIKSFSIRAWGVVVVIGPMMEELAYRLWLSMKKIHVAISSAFFLYYILGFVLAGYVQSRMTTAVISAIFALSVALSVYHLVSEDSLQNIKNNNTVYPFVVLSGCIIFALAHLTNYLICPSVLLWALVSCLPQLVGGISISYLRINVGFLFGLLFHCVINLLPCCMTIL